MILLHSDTLGRSAFARFLFDTSYYFSLCLIYFCEYSYRILIESLLLSIFELQFFDELHIFAREKTKAEKISCPFGHKIFLYFAFIFWRECSIYV